MRALRCGIVVMSLAAAAAAGERRVPFWPDEVPAALQRHVDGVAVLESVRALGRYHRVQGSPGFAAAAEWVRSRAEAVGLAEATVHRLPADGTTRYAHFPSYYGWDARLGVLEEVSPRPGTIARFPELPVALADYSQDADATAELVDVGVGTKPEDYARKTIQGRIVLASGSLPVVHQLAVRERGAAGFVSDFPNQTTPWSGDDRDLVRWGHLSPYETRNAFAFMVSKRQSEELRRRLGKGEAIVVRATVRARMVPGSYDVVTARIPGTDPKAGEVLFTAHLCHQSAGANDNASGSAAILEIGRVVATAIRDGSLKAPRRGLRFLWASEIAGSQAWLVRNPEIARGIVAGVHMDMVGGLLATTRGTFHLSRTAETLPHVINDVARTFFEEVVRASSAYAEHGGDATAGMVWLPGSREVFVGDVRGLELGSDHQVFQESSFGIPMVYFHDYPDVTIHTSKDQPENLDATKLGRVAYMGAGIGWTLAALPDAEAPRLLSVSRAGAEERLARARFREALAEDRYDGWLAVREAISTGNATLRSVAALWPSVGPPAPIPEVAAKSRSATPAHARVPVRSPDVRGPLNVYYYDHLQQALGGGPAGDVTGPPRSQGAVERLENGDLLAYEILNLVDGRRTVAEIRDVLTGRYESVPLDAVAEYLELLARAKVISWR